MGCHGWSGSNGRIFFGWKMTPVKPPPDNGVIVDLRGMLSPGWCLHCSQLSWSNQTWEKAALCRFGFQTPTWHWVSNPAYPSIQELGTCYGGLPCEQLTAWRMGTWFLQIPPMGTRVPNTWMSVRYCALKTHTVSCFTMVIIKLCSIQKTYMLHHQIITLINRW